MVKLHYGSHTFDLPDDYQVESELHEIESIHAMSNTRVGVAHIPLKDGGKLYAIISEAIPFAFEVHA